MTRIRFKGLRLSGHLLLALAGGLLGLATAELELYQDVQPKFRPEVKLERLVRFLEAKSHGSGLHQQPRPLSAHHHQPLPPPHEPLPQQMALQQQEELEELEQLELHRKQQAALHRKQQQLYRKHQEHLLDLARQKQRGILRDDLPERPNIIDVLQRQAADPLEYVRELERQRLLPYLEYEPPRIKQYSVEDEARARLLPQLNKDPLLDYPETQFMDLDQRARQLQENARRMIQGAHRRRPAFTFRFNQPEPQRESEPEPFAFKPNDPRFYEEDTGDTAVDPEDQTGKKPAEETHRSHAVDHHHDLVDELPMHDGHVVEDNRHVPMHFEPSSPKPRPVKPTPKRPREEHRDHELVMPRTGVVDMSMMPEPHRRAQQDPLVVSLDNKVNNDIYFIAIVAGCSAAAMFALVLISLTWCRLQRVSKAAADVEYPAYGVTGPNKDMSPSGDQRLAQSAQMYHFQHQKQQIIAMEKASATRDPGSVSEAESDEENEEGDYTVYECPGLAPTGEMEVKNPLFHDDPTPATPAKSSKRNDDDV
ncbi:uncharacterized protein LOC100678404 isoform X3 [Nasonia vitripennis]|uniref:Neural proliferation differentiation and control protein 1 n=1 Tax=Nasonia vitripennis TaxID=7425 RepID=A0A7M7T9W0_NASVI|nr:uncharacterized protein LOC100678404 isoform X3 [Nasonia vitripennis]